MTILLIDDDPLALKLLAHQLARCGYEDVRLHERAQDALALLASAQEDIDLVFCDLQMPDMDGVECLRCLARMGYVGGLVMCSG